jgi:hypothetical protein
MKTVRRITTTASLAICLLGLGITAARAEETVCRGTLGAVTVDNLRVPDGARCELNGTKVEGTIKVESRAVLIADEVRVIGNVQAENSKRVVFRDGRVGGSIQIVQSGSARVARTIVKGDILFDDDSRPVEAIRNRVGGNVQAFQNTGGVVIRGNRIDGNLQCKANRPRPTGGNNIVGGNKEDQCARL